MNFPETAKKLYPENQWEQQAERYNKAAERFETLFGTAYERIFSAPGRSEICGNHTDHNMGKAVGASVDLDILAFVKPRADQKVTILADGFAPVEVDLTNTALREEEKGDSAGLVRGVAAKMMELGYRVGGFDAYTTSNVFKGSGLSSSAAFEVVTVAILDHLYNEGKMPPKEMAIISQFAENVYFGKASGLLDQLSCAYGGMIAIDFENPKDPIVRPIDFDFATTGHCMVITDVHSDHADLTDDYVAIKSEMQAVANSFGKEYLRQVEEAEFEAMLPELHKTLSERALIRAYHYFEENKRVDALHDALQAHDFEQFKNIVTASGNSSYMYLQNIYSDKKPTSQAISLALCITQKMLAGKGAWRVHGGGFGGTIQAYVPIEDAESYVREMNRIFGEGSSCVLQIRPCGPVKVQ
ncbi:MAG: galactokinase [Clostridia bacterium]|nr:galactokinase [Clostridia bacterium]